MKKFLMPFFMILMVMGIAACSDDSNNGGGSGVSLNTDTAAFVDGLDYSILDGQSAPDDDIAYYKDLMKKMFNNILIEDVAVSGFGTPTSIEFNKAFLGNTDGKEIIVIFMTDFIKSFLPSEISGNQVTGFNGYFEGVYGSVFHRDILTQSLTVADSQNDFAVFGFFERADIQEWTKYRDKQNKNDEETTAIFQKFASKMKIYKFNINN